MHHSKLRSTQNKNNKKPVLHGDALNEGLLDELLEL